MVALGGGSGGSGSRLSDLTPTAFRLKFLHRQDRISLFIVKFPYNARSDWLKQRTLSEIREWVDDIELAFKFVFRNLDKFDPNYKHPLCDSDKININELFVRSKYGS